MADPIDFSGSEIEFQGKFFEGKAAIKLKNNLAVWVGKLAEDGRKNVARQIANRPYPNARARQPGRRRTGFTARSIEKYQDPPNSLYAKVRVSPEARRPGAKATSTYKAERIPYIVMAVLESARRGGTRQYKVVFNGRKGWARYKTTWKRGEIAGKQQPLWAFRNTARRMRSLAPGIPENLLLRDLD